MTSSFLQYSRTWPPNACDTTAPEAVIHLPDLSPPASDLNAYFSLAIAPWGYLVPAMPVSQSFFTSAMSNSALTQAHVFVSGTVQGVAYRAYTRQHATDLGVSGWVRNLRDGRVEAVFEGSLEAVEQMVQWCYSGSPSAVVTNVETAYNTPTGLQGFEIRHS